MKQDRHTYNAFDNTVIGSTYYDISNTDEYYDQRKKTLDLSPQIIYSEILHLRDANKKIEEELKEISKDNKMLNVEIATLKNFKSILLWAIPIIVTILLSVFSYLSNSINSKIDRQSDSIKSQVQATIAQEMLKYKK